MNRPTSRAAPDQVIGDRYRLESVLGRGGMGVVWAAHDEVLGRPVAIKEVLPVPGLTGDQLAEVRQRTLQEARAAASLSTPAALLVYDVVEQAGEPWIVMERLAPRTLADVLDERGRLEPSEVATLGLTLLEALDAAHRAGVLHRDVKPSNVMFRGDQGIEGAILADFGIARFAGDPTATATGTLIGSPAFVAPERARGEKATPASDLWSLGVTLWIAAEGVSPFHREGTLQTLTAVLTADLPPLEHAGPLAPALSGLLRKDPAERLDSQDVRRVLQRVPRSSPSAAQGSTAQESTAAMSVAASSAPAPVRPADESAVPVAVPVPVPSHETSVHDAPPFDRPAPATATGWPEGSSRSRSRQRGLLLGLLAAVLVAGGVALALALQGPADPRQGADRQAGASPSASSPSASPSDDASPTTDPDDTTPQPSTTPSDSPTSDSPTSDTTTTDDDEESPSAAPTADSDAVPAGMRRYSDPSGFSVAVPRGWTATRDGSIVRLRDPESSAYLLVDQTDDPKGDPVEDWREQERSVSRRLSNYRLIRIDPVSERGWKGADWEFTHGRGTHVLNRNLVTSPNQAYALYWSAPDSTWEASERRFEQVFRSFQPRR